MRAGEAALPSSTACCAMPDAPGATLCARFRSWAAAGDVARLICKEGGGGRRLGCWAGGSVPRQRGLRGRRLTVGCCAGAA